MKLVVNGSPHDYDAPPNLAALLRSLDLREDQRGLAVAVNDALIPRGTYGEVTLHEGDRIEIITAVQGG
jgi:sulfur carrier protein